MACTDKDAEEQSRLLANAQQAGKDALESILSLLPAEEEPWLTPVYPKGVSQWYTDAALQNIDAQLSDLLKQHMPAEDTRALMATILQLTCSFRQEMDNMATSQVFLPSQVIPAIWGACRGVLEGLSLLELLAVWLVGQLHWWSRSPPYPPPSRLHRVCPKLQRNLAPLLYPAQEKQIQDRPGRNHKYP